MKMPTFDDLINPLFKALKDLGNSGSVDEIYDKVIANQKYPSEILEVLQNKTSNQTKIAYRLAWARTYLKKFGAITNTSRAIWVINNEFLNYDKFNVKEVVSRVRAMSATTQNSNLKNTDFNGDDADLPEELKPWKEKLREILININPYAFENLIQRLLRECGLNSVEVTKKSGDGGIDGVGLLKLNGIISFKLAFQCKRYSGSVSSKEIRDFRGAITTDIEKALFITTGTYSREAKIEASTAGKLTIDLMNGDELIDKLAELKIGLKPTISYEIDEMFYNSFK